MNPRTLIRQIRDRLYDVYGDRLRKVVLYGSVAREESHETSDVDVLVVLDEVSSYSECLRTNIEALYPLATRIGRRISAKPVSEDDYNAGASPLCRVARREGIAA